MMGLADILQARAASQGRTATVSCGELGDLTVEALPVRELELLLRGADGPRKVFYAACRELQLAGEELRRAGQLYTPDGILQFVSDGEAESAARTVLELSGWGAASQLGLNKASDKNAGDETSRRVNNVYRPDEENSEIRLLSVQNTEKDFTQIRPAVVQTEKAVIPVTEQNRRETVQFPQEELLKNGQDSRETRPKNRSLHKLSESDTKSQGIGHFLPEAPQNVVSDFELARNAHQDTDDRTMPLHEIKSDFGKSLHETKSEYFGNSQASLHEIESEFGEKTRESLHETESDFFGEQPSAGLAESQNLHEMKSELRKILHETESELGEIFARQILEGLRRANWVRGG